MCIYDHDLFYHATYHHCGVVGNKDMLVIDKGLYNENFYLSSIYINP